MQSELSNTFFQKPHCISNILAIFLTGYVACRHVTQGAEQCLRTHISIILSNMMVTPIIGL